jgi:hypothetical protein
VALYREPYDERDERDAELPSLRFVAEKLDTTILRTRKLLITAEYYSTEKSRIIQELAAYGRSTEEIMETTHLKHASINSYLPYKSLAFNLDQTTVNADRHKLFRRRLKAVEELQQHMDLPDESLFLWKAIIVFKEYPFKTSGRNGLDGVKFAYTVSRSPSSDSSHYRGGSEEGYGNDLWITMNGETRETPISRSMVESGYKKAREMGVVKEPEALGMEGTEAYLWPVFIRFGVCTAAFGKG